MTHKNTHGQQWIIQPSPDHMVQFYSSESALIIPLSQYIITGIKHREHCIVIATPQHLRSLEAALIAAGIDLAAATANGYYLPLDASETLEKFMPNDTIDKTLFHEVVGGFVAHAAQDGRPIRAYGEMVALLWQNGKACAVMQLEELWNDLAKTYTFSLYCAYSELHFIYDQHIKSEISTKHTHNFELQPVAA